MSLVGLYLLFLSCFYLFIQNLCLSLQREYKKMKYEYNTFT